MAPLSFISSLKKACTSCLRQEAPPGAWAPASESSGLCGPPTSPASSPHHPSILMACSGLSAAERVCRRNQPQFAPRAWTALLASLTGKAFHHGRCHPPATGVPSTWGIGSHGPLLPLEAWAASFLGRAVGWQPGCTWETGAGASLCPGGRVNGQDWISLRREKPQAG